MKKNLVDHLYNIKDANRESDIVNFLVDTRPSPPHANATDDTDMDAMEKAFESIDKEISEYCSEVFTCVVCPTAHSAANQHNCC